MCSVSSDLCSGHPASSIPVLPVGSPALSLAAICPKKDNGGGNSGGGSTGSSGCIPTVLFVTTAGYSGPATYQCMPRPGVNVCGRFVMNYNGKAYYQHMPLSTVPLVQRNLGECPATY